MATALVPRSAPLPDVQTKFAIYLVEVAHDPAIAPSHETGDWENVVTFLEHWHFTELDRQTGLVPLVRYAEGGVAL